MAGSGRKGSFRREGQIGRAGLNPGLGKGLRFVGMQELIMGEYETGLIECLENALTGENS